MEPNCLITRRLLVLVLICLLGRTATAASGTRSEESLTTLPEGALAQLGQPARFVGVPWEFDPVAHDRFLNRLAYVDLAGNVILEDVASGRRRTALDRSVGSVFKLRISPDGRFITALSEEGDGYELDVRNPASLRVLEPKEVGPPYPPRVLASSPKRKYEAVEGADCVELRQSGHEDPVACLQVEFEPPPSPPGLISCHGAAPYSAVFSSNNTKVAVWRSWSKLLVHDLGSHKQLRLDTLGDQIVTASFSSDSKQMYLVHAHEERMVERWSVEDGRRLPDLPLEDDDDGWKHIQRPAWLSPNGRLLIARHRSGLAAWRPEDGQLLWRIPNGIFEIRQFSFSADQSKFLTLSDRSTLPGVLEVRLTDSGAPIPENPGHQLRVSGLTFSPDGQHLVSTDGVSESIAWDVGARRAVARVTLPWNRRGSYSPVAGRTQWISTSGIDDLSVQGYDGARDYPRLLRGAGPDLGMMAMSSDERDVVVLNEQTDQLCVWDLRTATRRWCRELDKPSTRTINFAELQFSGDDDSIVVLSETGELLRWRRGDGTPRPSVTLLPDHAAASASAPTATTVTRHQLAKDDCEFWLVEEGSARNVLFSSTRQRGPIWRSVELPSLRCSFTPDNRLAVLLDDKGQVELRRASDGSELAVLTGHQGAVLTFAISPDGALLATAGEDHVIYLWQLSPYR